MGGSTGRDPRVQVLRPRPTMIDVAREAGVALKTVSRVVNDEPGVRPATAERVRVAIARLRLSAVRRGTPVGFLVRPPRGIEADAVLLDDRAAARAGVVTLLEAGHRRVGLVGGRRGRHAVEQRVAGASDALVAAGLSLDGALLRLGAENARAAEDAARDLLAQDPPVTAVFALGGRQVAGVARALGGSPRPAHLLVFGPSDLAGLLPLPVTVIDHDA